MGKFGKYAAVGLSVLTIGGSSLAIIKRRDITDWLILRNYHPSSEIRKLSENTELSSLGQKLFYVYDPQLLSKDGFNTQCTVGEQTIVLGCYDGKGIYLYDISDPQLNGVEEVTSAHEMLHAAYDRLSKDERKEIDALVKEAIDQSGDDRIKTLVEAYRQRDASSLNNEMHSIVGTELRNISPQLEKYYSKYFINRIKIVEYSEKYELVFTNLQTQVKQIDADLISRKSEIDSLESSLQSQAASLKEWEARLNNYKATGQIEQYNSEVEDFNQNIRSYNRQIETLRTLIDEYNQKVIERNNLALQQNELIKHLDSRAAEL